MAASAPIKCAVSAALWILAVWIVGALSFAAITSSSSSSSSGGGSSSSRSKTTILRHYDELRQVEDIPAFRSSRAHPPVARSSNIRRSSRLRARRGVKKDESATALSNSEKWLFFFPDPRVASVDPTSRKRNAAAELNQFFPGREWRDLDGKPIQAHGGGILYVPQTGVFYWYGENKDGPTYRLSKRSSPRVDLIGISCYSSRDLWHWKSEGIVLQPDTGNSSNSLHITNVLERPKVIYNARSRQYVMWMHLDSANYSRASVGVAVSSRPEGPFVFIGSMRPHGFESRDMTLFKDDDEAGTAYLIYSSQSNSELHISPLTDDYLGVRNIMSRALVNQHREAPAVFKHRGLYYMVTSGCTGWLPNPAMVHVAESMLGAWYNLGDPCVGATEEFRSTTFYSQVSFVLPLPGLADTFIFVGDRWNPIDLRDSRYVWLPLTMDGPVDEPPESVFEFPLWSRVSIRWHSRWKLPAEWNETL